ncbi:hypothetical protein C8R34_10248 [Nitrosomonas sp. Nm84]|uniref:hypothetical protein n=1 Tax=Nitrosomonas sp. Nm84 TaxID=200124 RepID=UPI000D8EDF30|nr:hypothetical protein [Nitrosomonas sp. Nm84]PXW90736.1 hypothetical protein C8R34_10248 [Nitrosomonas sp. Nm84]
MTNGESMKMLRILVFTIFSLLFQGNVFGTSIAYSGFICLNTIDINDITSSGIPIESRFEVIEDVGGGIFRLRLTGGIPRIVNNDRNVCIDNVTAIGYSGFPLPELLEAIDAIAYFSGQELIIVVSSMFTDLSARRGAFSSFSTSKILAITNTLIFAFNPQASSFSLSKVIRNTGFTHTETGSTISIPFLETVLPSDNGVSQSKPLILTPTSSIEYRLE